MRSMRFLLISIVALCATSGVVACGPFRYLPSGYAMYRVCELASDDELPSVADANCREWQRMTSSDISLEEIHEVVYDMSLEEYEAMCANRKVSYENKFAEWLTKRNHEAMEFLLLAKTNEYIRLQRNSRWYYPTMKIGARMTLEEVAEVALNASTTRLHDRYMLQGVRALFTLGRYHECIALWENEVAAWPKENLMRQMIYPYIAGAKYHVGNRETALAIFAELGDVDSMLRCLGKEGKHDVIDGLALVCEHNPQSPYIVKTLQKIIRSEEPEGNLWGDYPVDEEKLEKLHALCVKMAQDKRTDKHAMWYYTAAFISDLKGNTNEAAKLLTKAEMQPADTYLKESIKVFRIYIDSKQSTYNDAYEQHLFAQLKWLDEKIVNNITDEVREQTAEGYHLLGCYSYYYWNDMMRRILLTEVCPRMLESGRTTRALQLANMASNRLLGIVDRQKGDYHKVVNGEFKFVEYDLTMDEYRYSEEHYNSFDYRSHFFEMIDSIGLDVAIKYVDNTLAPRNDFDRFLNSRGYIGKDYLYDIIGTQCLRHMRYTEAKRYLGEVSKRYYFHLNVCMEYAPFDADRVVVIPQDSDFKYRFASEMSALEQDIRVVEDPNRRAMMTLRYAIGMKNSFSYCWGLTQYYLGSCYFGQSCHKRDWEGEAHTKAVMKRADELIDLACRTATDDVTRAEIQYALCNFKTVAEQYPNTSLAQRVRSGCDLLYDHHADRRPEKLYWHGW